jgi:four helix bundle protein
MKKDSDIHDRIYVFVINVLSILKEINRTTENIVLIRQITRSVTSMGVNSREADGSEPKEEFIYRFTIAKKEAKETHYWLRLLSDTNSGLNINFEKILDECEQLILILSKIVINAKKDISHI